MDVSRISHSGQAQPGKAGRAASSEGFSQLMGARPASSASVNSTTPTGALDALLAVQEAESALDRKARARRRAVDLIEGLDQIREGLLSGEVSGPRLDALAATLAQQRDEADDPKLGALLDEIELRVHVELAKLGRVPPGFA